MTEMPPVSTQHGKISCSRWHKWFHVSPEPYDIISISYDNVCCLFKTKMIFVLQNCNTFVLQCPGSSIGGGGGLPVSCAILCLWPELFHFITTTFLVPKGLRGVLLSKGRPV